MQANILEIIRDHGPLPFRKIEAHLVLKDFDVATYAVQCALGKFVDNKQLVLRDNFTYAFGTASMWRLTNITGSKFVFRHKTGVKIYEPGESWLCYPDEIPRDALYRLVERLTFESAI